MAWSQQADPMQWASAYYGYGYDPYAYGAAQDPSLYSYGATYPGYGQYPQQVRFNYSFFYSTCLLAYELLLLILWLSVFLIKHPSRLSVHLK